MKEDSKQFLAELRSLLGKYDMTIWFDCDSIDGIYGDHLEICRRSDDEIIFRTENGDWGIDYFNLPKE